MSPEAAKKELEAYTDYKGIQLLKEGDLGGLDVHLASIDHKTRRSTIRGLVLWFLIVAMLITSRMIWSQPTGETFWIMIVMFTGNVAIVLCGARYMKRYRRLLLCAARRPTSSR